MCKISMPIKIFWPILNKFYLKQLVDNEIIK